MAAMWIWRLLLTSLIVAEELCSVSASERINPFYKGPRFEPLSGRWESSLERSRSLAEGFGSRFAAISTDGSTRRKAAGVTHVSPRQEVEALISFKSGITSDPLGALRGWHANDSDACSWTGVKCSPNSDHVTALSLSGLQLGGTVSSLLGQLAFLQIVDLSNNLFIGFLPPALSNCSSMVQMDMSFNAITGDIPPDFGQLNSLQILDLSTNNLTGEIPERLGNCSMLLEIQFYNNQLVGGVPPQFGLLSNLHILNVSFNSLSGSIPPALGNCTQLRLLDFSQNLKISGELPTGLGNLKNLEFFWSYTNTLQGNFPTWLLNCTNLVNFAISDNLFSGEIPESVGQFLELEGFGVPFNSFTGQIPRSIVNITTLLYFYVHANLLNGAIPSEIGRLTQLTSFLIYNNNLTGVIPPSLSNCSQLNFFYGGSNNFDPQPFPSYILALENLTNLYLGSSNLHGEIPAEMGLLAQLLEFDVYGNHLTGSLPASFANCTQLSFLVVANNQLTGHIPPELGSLTLLWEFTIRDNPWLPSPFPQFIFNWTNLNSFQGSSCNLYGKLDGDFGVFQSVYLFNFDDNSLEGPIPETLSNCSSLQYLYLEVNRFSGGIPAGFFNMTSLACLGLRSNQLTGTIPVGFTWSSLLVSIDFHSNKLEGTIPPEFGQIANLNWLDLSYNNFSGPIPDTLITCVTMTHLYFSHNQLTGSIPGAALASSALTLSNLDVSSNLLSGSWPREFEGFQSIQYINVSGNNLSGSIPLGLGKCLTLETLDLSFNNFTGAIPTDLGSLTYLYDFNASYNNFSGPVPTSGFFNTSNDTESSFLGNLGLCGRVLGRPCAAVAPAPSPVSLRYSPSHCSGSNCVHAWVWIVIGVSLGIILLGVALLFIYPFHFDAKNRVRTLPMLSTYVVDPRMRFTEKDIYETIAMGQENVIGVGTKSTVYKSVLQSGETVAVKVLIRPPEGAVESGGSMDVENATEAHTLAQLRHRNVIKVFGYLSKPEFAAIVLEYMPMGNLYVQLHETDPCQFTWGQRLKIIQGVTDGLVYLHHDFPEPIIHRDLKTSNILLDGDMEGKLCDFGISKFVTRDHGEATASNCCGTFGYMPPEYGTGAKVSTKGDVFSYGVVLLEILTSKPAVIQNDILTYTSQSEHIVHLVESCFIESEYAAYQLLDVVLKNEGMDDSIIREQMLLTMRLGLLCTRENPQDRPSMKSVFEMLVDIKEVGQESITKRTLEEILNVDEDFA